MAEIVQLFTALDAGEPMVSHESVEAVSGGLVGDRYLRGTGHYAPYDGCEVTLVASEALAHIREQFGIDLFDGRHRRNVVLRGIDPEDLLETTVKIGAAELRGTRRRPPCAHVERVAREEGVARALGEQRGGVCATVVSPGNIRVGDDVEIAEPDPRSMGQAIADRLSRDDG